MRDYDFEGEPFVVIEREEPGIGTLLLGVAIGAGLALLFAPRTGADTRRMIGTRARRASDRVTDRVGAARDAIRRGQDQVLDAVDAGRSAAAEARTELERKIAENKAARRDAHSL